MTVAETSTTDLTTVTHARWNGPVSHELNNVLSVIRGCSELLLEVPGDRLLVSTCARDILTACEALTRLSWQLQVTGGRISLAIDSCRLEDWATLLRRRAAEMAIGDLTIRMAPSCPETAPFDGPHLATALLNHIADGRSNGATGATLELSGDDDTLLITVRDRRKQPEGAPGLRSELTQNAVQNIIADMAGHAFVRTEPLGQTCLSVRFPLHVVAPPRVPTRTASAPRRILVVDDEPRVVATLERVLARAGCSVRAFVDPEAALAHVTAAPEAFDLALIDVMMPELTGPELLSSLRRAGVRLPVVFMSSAAPIDPATCGAKGMLTKPFSRVELLSSLGLPHCS